jgi:YihY family inner membrane protein
MATRRQTPPANTVQQTASQAVDIAKGGAKSFADFTKKFKNDWSFHLAQALAFSLITAIVPVAILLLALIDSFIGSLSGKAKDTLISNITKAFPAPLSSADVVNSALSKLHSASGFLTFLAIVVALVFGSRLFTLMEACFDVVYRLHPRPTLRKNVTALVMLVLFVILIPILVLASTVPGFVLSFLQSTPLSANVGFLPRFFGIISSLIVSFILFEAFYVFVPNRQENVPSVMNRIRTSWMGSAVAAVVLQIMLLLFPVYVQSFMKGYEGQIALVLILLAFFYLFALIILLGAEVNAFFAEGIRPSQNDLIAKASN